MKKFKYEFEVDDDFEVGCCMCCPLSEITDDDYLVCKFSYNYENCPLKEVINVDINR